MTRSSLWVRSTSPDEASLRPKLALTSSYRHQFQYPKEFVELNRSAAKHEQAQNKLRRYECNIGRVQVDASEDLASSYDVMFRAPKKEKPVDPTILRKGFPEKRALWLRTEPSGAMGEAVFDPPTKMRHLFPVVDKAPRKNKTRSPPHGGLLRRGSVSGGAAHQVPKPAQGGLRPIQRDDDKGKPRKRGSLGSPTAMDNELIGLSTTSGNGSPEAYKGSPAFEYDMVRSKALQDRACEIKKNATVATTKTCPPYAVTCGDADSEDDLVAPGVAMGHATGRRPPAATGAPHQHPLPTGAEASRSNLAAMEDMGFRIVAAGDRADATSPKVAAKKRTMVRFVQSQDDVHNVPGGGAAAGDDEAPSRGETPQLRGKRQFVGSSRQAERNPINFSVKDAPGGAVLDPAARARARLESAKQEHDIMKQYPHLSSAPQRNPHNAAYRAAAQGASLMRQGARVMVPRQTL
eukprot:TRINITY_DN1829_c0_g1_i1.p1 TRINITY_DN1829_c0_g1~~TRINITY_DN1829_c0_g1_i1.p1  ORF type:complete len:482 (+),score=174.08 TRINITY_DN1829_c0_g1_i1:59-1447(+)